MPIDGRIILVVLAVVLFAAVLIPLSIRQQKREAKRRDALAAFAEEFGFQIDLSYRLGYPRHEYEHFEMFRSITGCTPTNTIRGHLEIAGHECKLLMGDFKYSETKNNSKTPMGMGFSFSYAIFPLPYVGVPKLVIRKEGWQEKVSSAMGAGDIDFESSEFSRRFLVQSPDEQFAYDIVHPKMMEFLMEAQPPMVLIENDHVCLIGQGAFWTADEFQDVVHWAKKFCELWPERVTEGFAHGNGENA